MTAALARVGFLGLGAMGSGMAGRLLDAGFPLTVYNRTSAKAQPLGKRGARIAATPAHAAQDVDILFVSLATSAAVEESLFGDQGAMRSLAAGAIVADMSTVAPAFAVSLAERVSARGGRALDACVLGNAQHARDGQLRFMVGGAEDDVTAVRPPVEAMSKEITHVGGHGMGATAKLAMNLLMGVQMQALSEAIVFAERAGLPRDTFLSLVAPSGYSSPVMRFKSGVMMRREFRQADFRLALMRKDLALVLAEALRLGVPMPTVAASHQVLTSAANAGLGDADCAAVLVEMERMAGSGPDS